MHHQRSAYSLRRIRRVAYHFLLNVVLGIIAISAVVYSVYYQNETWLYASLGGVVFWLISSVFFYIKGAGVRCSLCMTPLWLGRKCQKHKNVKPALGVSYRLGMATAVVFKGHYRCPYCGEPFSALKIRGDQRRG